MEEFQEEMKSKTNSSSSDRLNLLNMIESRIMEIVQIEKECKRKLPKLYSQRLPRFMRRRAACHNIRRLPKKLRPTTSSDFGSKDRRNLLKYRRRVKFRKHKRSLRKHARHQYKNPNKFLLHKWFAKRFKLHQGDKLDQVPLFNNTKNQRNLYRQTIYGCAYLSMSHMAAMQVNFKHNLDDLLLDYQLNLLNRLTRQVSGFTFQAQALKKGRYELAIHIFKPNSRPSEYLCTLYATLKESQKQDKAKKTGSQLNLWIPRSHFDEIHDYLKTISEDSSADFTITKLSIQDYARVRLIGPDCRKAATKITSDLESHKSVVEDVGLRLNCSLGISIGRFVEEKHVDFTYFNTKPQTVDVVFKKKPGRMLWHELVKNKAHLVGGLRDLENLMQNDCLKLKPDC